MCNLIMGQNLLTQFGWVMAYQSEKERSMRNANLYECPPSWCLHPYIQLRHCAFGPGAHSEHFESCLWYVMKIEEKELHRARWGSWAILTKNEGKNLHAVSCQVKALECDSATLSIAQRSCASVDQILRRHKGFGYNWVFIQFINWMSIMTISLFVQNYWPDNNF